MFCPSPGARLRSLGRRLNGGYILANEENVRKDAP